MNIAITSQAKPDYQAIKNKQRATWGSGDYARIGSTLQVTGENLAEAMDLKAGRSVLDVAAGNGNMTLAAARRFCAVVSTDYVEDLLERGRQRASANGFDITFQYADAEALPFEDNSFDNVVSTFGVMFAPDQIQCAKEMQRVCARGGKIGMANWTPDGFIGQVFKLIGKYIAPPAGVSSPARWGTREFISTEFGELASHIQLNMREFIFRYESAEHWLNVFRTYYGPTLKAFESLDKDSGDALASELTSLINRMNTAQDGAMCVPSQYAEVIITL